MASQRNDHPPAPVPARPSLSNLREAVHQCRACDLWAGATQAVIGEGKARSRLMLVGEQPGDREDIEGRPFVGPAGRVLAEGLGQVGLDPAEAYVTNVVKHFRYKARGKRRIHQKPDRWQVSACLPWLEAELAVVRPDALVALGATAAQALFGPQIRIGRDRGQPIECELAELTTLTAHPSSILRAPDEEARQQGMADFVADLRSVASWLAQRSGQG